MIYPMLNYDVLKMSPNWQNETCNVKLLIVVVAGQ